MKKTLYCLMLSSLGITTACVDNSYDLSKDIDMTVTVGGDLTSPGNSSEDITLEDLLDIDTLDSDLKLDAQGNYQLEMNGDPTNSTVSVSNVTIIDAYTSDKNESDVIKFNMSLWSGDNAQTVPIEGLNPSMELRNDGEEVPEDVVDLESATIDGTGKVLLNLDIKGDAKKVTLEKGLKFVFPEFITVKPNSYFTKDTNSKNTWVLNDNYTIVKNVGAQWPFEIEKIYFKKGYNGVPSEQGFNKTTRSVYFNVNVPIQGNVSVNKSDFSSSTGEVSFQLVAKVSSQKMNLGKVKAKVDPVIDFNVADVIVKNLPDFLTDNDVTADLYNPQVYLKVNNQTPVEVNFKAKLLAIKGHESTSIALGTDRNEYVPQTSIRLKPGKENILCLCPHPEEIKTNSDDTTFIKVENLSDLIKTIPDTIKVDVDEHSVQVMQEEFDENGNNKGDKFYEINLGRDFNVTTDYSIKAPLEFGKGFNIVYKDTVNGWNDDIENYEMKKVEVSLNAVNAIPLNLELSAKAVDINGNEMPNVEVSVTDPNKDESGEKAYVMAGTLEEKKTTSLIITLSTKDGVSRIKNLDGLIFTLKGYVAPETERQTLNKNQTLKLDDLKLRIKGGVTLDLN